jgi:hypothetical protein
MNSEQRFTEVCGRIKKALNLETDSALAAVLGLKTNTFANRKKDGSLPFDQIEKLADSENLSLDFIFWGKGPRIESAADNSQPPNVETLALIHEWLAHWWEHSADDERVWLNVQLQRCVPEYRDWLERRGRPR